MESLVFFLEKDKNQKVKCKKSYLAGSNIQNSQSDLVLILWYFLKVPASISSGQCARVLF